ncbi:hypothetical protein EDC96DRAFT_596411 [Choanephora cucurbitarum]|nr:hypothetical protein EDC96DRAFT_596411 [Choanephora cucurbitarum]
MSTTYIVVVRHPITGTGCPVAYMLTEDHSMNRPTEHAAITRVYSEATIQWCLLHVSRAWMGKIRELVKLELSASNSQTHKTMITDLKAMMWEKEQETFLMKIVSFNMKFSQHTAFLTYMERTCLNCKKSVHWSAAFQPFTNMETNNYIESWHNQLNTTYLGRKKNRRVDRLIYILVNDVEPDYISNVGRISLKIGRMGPQERRRRRKREIAAESINEAIIDMMIEETDDVEFANGKMKFCSRADFKWNVIACKHMYLFKRKYNNIAVFQVSLYHSALLPARPVEDQASETNASATNVNPVLNIVNNLQATLNSFKHNRTQLTDEQLQQLAENAANINRTLQDSMSSGSSCCIKCTT